MSENLVITYATGHTGYALLWKLVEEAKSPYIDKKSDKTV